MSVNDRKVFVMALMLVALVSIFVPVASAVSETWYLYPTSTGGPPAYLHLEKTYPETGGYNIGNGKTPDWNAGPAQCSLTLGEGQWSLYLDCTAPTNGGTIDIRVSR